MKALMTTIALTTCLLGLGLQCQASLIIWDQTNTPSWNALADIATSAPVGQEFTPAATSLQVVELGLQDTGGTGATLRVDIYAGSVYGTLLGSSLNAVMPDDFAGMLQFDFASPIALTAGNTYVISPVLVSGSNVSLQGVGTGSTYPGGTAILFGGNWDDGDFLFREGYLWDDIPEPATGGLMALGVACLLLRRRSRR